MAFARTVMFRFLFATLSMVLSASAFLLRGSHPQVSLSVHNGLRPVGKWAALGDSYAAGIGAGKRLLAGAAMDAPATMRPIHVLHSHYHLGSNETFFDFLACSGATSEDVITKQISTLAPDSLYDLITLSAGGNDVGLSDILNACIYQWSGGDDALCDEKMNEASNLVNTTLADNMDKLHAALIPHLSLNGLLFHTGYAKFFDISDSACNNVTWSFWYVDYLGWKKQFLTQQRRRRLNELADATNRAIQASVERAALMANATNIRVRFIDYDTDFGKIQGRFCEPGVEEPAPNRENLLFYEWDTTDDQNEIEHGPDGLRSGNTTDGSFEGRIVKWVEEGKSRHPEAMSRAQHGSKQVGEKSVIIPDGYLRVFHPRPMGHAIVAEKIVSVLIEEQQRNEKSLAERPEL